MIEIKDARPAMVATVDLRAVTAAGLPVLVPAMSGRSASAKRAINRSASHILRASSRPVPRHVQSMPRLLPAPKVSALPR